MAILKQAETEFDELVDETETEGRRFYRALEDGLDDAGFYRAKGETFAALTKFGWMTPADGDEQKDTEQRAAAARDAHAKVSAAQSFGVDPNGIYGHETVASATSPIPKAQPGDDLV